MVFEFSNDVERNQTYRSKETEKPMEKGPRTEKLCRFLRLYREPQATFKTEKPHKNWSKTEKPLAKGTKTAKAKVEPS